MTLHYTRRGSGEPLVLIHGLGASGLVWDPVLELLSAARDVIVPDLPGFGRSAPLPRGTTPTPAILARVLVEKLRELGVERPHVAGNSLGGWVALEMGRGDAASVAAISPAGLWRRPLGPRSIEIQRFGRLLLPLLGPLLHTRSGRAALLRSTVAHPERVSAAATRALVRDWLTAPGYTEANREMRRGALEHPDEIAVPVTIIRGDRDRLVAPPAPERTPPGSVLIELEDAGHTPTWDQPDVVADLLLEASSLRLEQQP